MARTSKETTENGITGGKEAGATDTPRTVVQITAPKFAVAQFPIEGTSPYVQHKFSEKARKKIQKTQEAGQQSRKGVKREPRNFEADYEAAMYIADEGWHGIPAAAFRHAGISACRLVGFKMTIAKLTIFVEADGYCGSTALVRITEGKPEPTEPMAVRNDNGSMDLRVRPMWRPGWKAKVRIRYDEDQFSLADVTNLLARAGQQVGVGEGRPDSKESAGMGWGLFKISEAAK